MAETPRTGVRHAIFGNAGVMGVFRMGVDDATLVAKEMGVFTADEIMNLELGQAIVRTGGSSTAYNIQTYPPCPPPQRDSTEFIRQQTRQLYAKRRADVERELEELDSIVPSSTPEQPPPPPSSKKRRRGGRGKGQGIGNPSFPSDPNEDDLVN